MKLHYVYKLENPNTKEFYFGSRSCDCNPIDDEYMGSMTAWVVDKNILEKIIVKSNFKNRTDAVLFESELIKNHINDSLNRNYHIPNENFHKDGSSSNPFTHTKKMWEYLNKYNIPCKTKYGEDVDWLEALNNPEFYNEVKVRKFRFKISKISFE